MVEFSWLHSHYLSYFQMMCSMYLMYFFFNIVFNSIRDIFHSAVLFSALYLPLLFTGCSLCIGWFGSAKSKRGWITSGGKTAFFCQRFNTRITLLLSSCGHFKRLRKVVCIFFANRGANTSFSIPNWCRDCLTIESITYNPGTLYSGLH